MTSDLKKNHSFEFLKGVLIFLVVTGHILTGNYNCLFNEGWDINIRGGIYLVHMPLFFGVSGYFFKNNMSSQKLKKWVVNLTLIFLVAAIIHQILIVRNATVFSFVFMVTSPFNHLWYLPALIILAISYFFLINKGKVSIKHILIVALLFGVVAKIFSSNFLDSNTVREWKVVLRIFEFAPFFIFSNLIKHKIRIKFLSLYFLGGLSLLGLFIQPIITHQLLNAVVYSLAFYGFNFSLIYLLFNLFTKQKGIEILPFNLLGKTSLFIYLWHFLFIYLVQKFVEISSLWVITLCGFGISIILALLNEVIIKIQILPSKFFGIR